MTPPGDKRSGLWAACPRVCAIVTTLLVIGMLAVPDPASAGSWYAVFLALTGGMAIFTACSWLACWLRQDDDV